MIDSETQTMQEWQEARIRLIQRYWRILVAVCAVVAAVLIPVGLVLDSFAAFFFPYLCWGLTAVFGADMLFHLYQSGWLVRRSPRSRSRHAWRWFVTDLAATIPFVAFLSVPILQLLRLLKVTRIAQGMWLWQRKGTHNPNIVRLVFFCFWLSLSAHWIACGWLALHGASDTLDAMTDYLRALYWCVTTLTTVGYGDITPSTNPELLYTMMVMILGVGVYGYVIGSVASALSSIDPARVRHRELVEKVTAFMRYRQIPTDLQRRILAYYDYLWQKRRGYDESAAIAELPSTLRVEVSLFLNRDILQKVPLFQEGSDDFLKAVAFEMRPVVYLPGDYIIHAGDVGEDMYFISQGSVEVESADGTQIYATLTSGDFFGEIALLFDEPRTASVRSIDYCDVYVLSRASLDHVITRYPRAAAHIRAVAEKRREENLKSEA